MKIIEYIKKAQNNNNISSFMVGALLAFIQACFFYLVFGLFIRFDVALLAQGFFQIIYSGFVIIVLINLLVLSKKNQKWITFFSYLFYIFVLFYIYPSNQGWL